MPSSFNHEDKFWARFTIVDPEQSDHYPYSQDWQFITQDEFMSIVRGLWANSYNFLVQQKP